MLLWNVGVASINSGAYQFLEKIWHALTRVVNQYHVENTRPTHSPSQCENDNQTTAVGFMDEITKNVFFHRCIRPQSSIPPRPCLGLAYG